MHFYRSRQDIRRRHNPTILVRIDSVNSRKAFPLEFCFKNKKIQKHFSSQALKTIIELKRELEQKLTPLILKNLNNNVWPLEDFQLSKEVKGYIDVSIYLLSIMSSRKFVKSFSISINGNYKILTDNYETINTKRLNPSVDKKKIRDLNNWFEILKEAELTMDSILTKVWSVELVSISEGHETPGIDNRYFLTVPRITKSKTDALKYLNGLIKKLKYDVSLSKGAINQAIQRKGLDNLNNREKYRRYLKNSKGKLYIKESKKQYRLIFKDPVEYVNKLRASAIENNLELKFNITKSLKLLEIKNYVANPLLRV